MAEEEDKLHSVRVELENSSSSGDDPALVDGGVAGPSVQSAGISRWVIAAGFAVVGLLVVLFGSLRPADDAALDGIDRGTTTTTTSVAPEVVEEATDEPAAGVVEDSEAAVGVSPTIIEFDGSIQSIVSGEVGFIAVARGESSSPTILRSLDGVDWFDVETSASTNGEPVTGALLWFNLVPFDGALALNAFDSSGSVLNQNEVFVSDDGADWVTLEFASDSDNGGGGVFVYRFNADSLIGFRNVGSSRLEELVQEVSTLPVSEAGVCDAFTRSGLASVPRYEVIDCRGEPVGTIDDSNLRGGISAEDLSACVTNWRNGSLTYIQDEELVRQDLAQDGELTVLGTITNIDFPVNMSNGGVAVVDGGVPTEVELDACREFIELPESTDQSIVVVDAVSNELVRFAFPDEWLPSDGSVPIRLVGEVSVTGRSQLVVQFEGALWTVDLESGEWDGPHTSPQLEEIIGLNRVGFSESGTRAYAVGPGELVTLDFVVGLDGSLEVHELVQPLANDRPNGAFVQILHANDDELFFGDFESTWVVDAPPLPNEPLPPDE